MNTDRAKERWTAYLKKRGMEYIETSNVMFELYSAGYSAGYVDGIAEVTTRRSEISDEDKERLNGKSSD